MLRPLLADWVATNAFIGAGAESRYSYPGDRRLREPARPTTQDRVALGGTMRSSVHQQAARYIELPTGTYRLRFDGARTARVGFSSSVIASRLQSTVAPMRRI